MIFKFLGVTYNEKNISTACEEAFTYTWISRKNEYQRWEKSTQKKASKRQA